MIPVWDLRGESALANAPRALAKLTRPRIHAAVRRTRLFKRLDRRSHYPIIWVSGPPGSGKTTLVATYLETREAKVFWYQIDEGDRDPAAFFHYLAELAKQARSRKTVPLPILTADHLPDLTGFTRRFFRELFARLGTNAVLVLDNCQDAAGEAFHLILREACEELPDGACVLFLSRSIRPDELTRHLANRRVLEIGWNELRLLPTETREIANLSAAHAQTFHDQCEGWVAGLVLLLANRDATKTGQSTPVLKSKEAMFAYFAGEVFLQIAQQGREMLMRTALFPYVTHSMAIEITANPASGRYLASLYEKQFFTDRKADHTVTYQYHDLFREFLLIKLAESHDQSALDELSLRAAQILETNNLLNEAVALYRRAKDWANVSRLITRHGQTLVETGRWETVTEWFKEFPDELMNGDPKLLLWRGESILPMDLSLARDFAERAYHEFVIRAFL